jgi:hypothetical protein
MWIDLSQLKALKYFSSIFDNIYTIPTWSHDTYLWKSNATYMIVILKMYKVQQAI